MTIFLEKPLFKNRSEKGGQSVTFLKYKEFDEQQKLELLEKLSVKDLFEMAKILKKNKNVFEFFHNLTDKKFKINSKQDPMSLIDMKAQDGFTSTFKIAMAARPKAECERIVNEFMETINNHGIKHSEPEWELITENLVMSKFPNSDFEDVVLIDHEDMTMDKKIEFAFTFRDRMGLFRESV